jgi:hypothetical protein
MPNINDYGLPFTSQDGDRKYSALEWREYFSRLIHNGLIQNAANECQVKPQAVPNKTVYVDTGVVFINGAMRILEEPITLAVAENTSGNPRIDRVVARLNEASRTIEFAVLEGTPAGSPVAPDLTRTVGVYELGLADITLANGYSTITTAEITDQRWDVSLCGASSMTIGVIPPSGMEAQTVTVADETASMYGLSGIDKNVEKALLNVFEQKKTIEIITASGTWTPPKAPLLVDVFIIGGGGGGGGVATAKYMAGGGGGGYVKKLFNHKIESLDPIPVVIGAGGAGGSFNGANGGISSFGDYSTMRQAGGGQGAQSGYGNGGAGGAGGGGGYYNNGTRGGNGGSGYGEDGEPGQGGGGIRPGGIGATITDLGGFCPFNNTLYGGGGGAGGYFTQTAGLGGNGGGGNGGKGAKGSNGTRFGAGGGGGGSTDVTGFGGGDGYQGAVIIAYNL